jgi:hypothetical protein
VTRSELHLRDASHKNITLHDLRATGITWMAVRGDDPLRIKQRAGHSSFSTTEVYIREAENLARGFGDPFPPLPSDLVQATDWATGTVEKHETTVLLDAYPSGEKGIRTPGTIAGTPDFESGTFGHSDISPRAKF